jgi:hypothetical protein
VNVSRAFSATLRLPIGASTGARLTLVTVMVTVSLAASAGVALSVAVKVTG